MTDSLKSLLDKLAPIDDEMPPEDFDPAALIGDIREKIDAIKWRMDDWDAKANMIEQEWIKPLQQKVFSLRAKSLRLKTYVKSQMIEHGFEKLPGDMVRAQLQNTAPVVDVDKEPLFSDFQAYPNLVKQDVTYSWQKKTMLDLLKAGVQLSFARLKENKSLRFYAQGDK